jgi:hypothetical protein
MFTLTPALAQQAVVPGGSTQARSQISQTAPTYQPTYGGGYVANYGGPMAYIPPAGGNSGPYAQSMPSATYGSSFTGVDGVFNPGGSDQERSLYTQHAPTIGWPGDPQRRFW